MAFSAPKVRDDLEYFEQVDAGEEIVLVRDPVRNTYFRYNPLQAAMLRGLDGYRKPADITAQLSEQFEVEIPPVATERFIARVRELLLLDISSYDVTPEKARKHVRKALRKAGFRERSIVPTDGRPRALSTESTLFTEAFRQLELGHPRAAAGYLARILERNPDNVRAKQLYDLIQRAYITASANTNETPMWVLFNPSRMLTWMSRTFGRFLFSWMGVVALFAIVCVAAHAVTQISFDSASSGRFDIAVTVVVMFTAFIFHELGHGFACQHYGGNVTEIGFMLVYYVQPAAFCDTSSSYTIPDRRHKVAIQLAGPAASALFLSGHAIVLALLSPNVAIYPGLCVAFMITLALTFVTLIPFIQSDGYYAICDYFAFPNLRQRSFKIARAWLSERLLGLPIPSEELPPRTRMIVIAYAVASFLFTAWFIYFIYFRLLAPIVERFRGVGLLFGLLLSLYLLRRMMLRPIWAFFRLLVRERRRIFTVRRTAIFVVILAAVIGPWFLRWPVLVDDTFVVVPHERADVRAQTAGRVEQILVKEGETVRRGAPLAVLRNAQLEAQLATLDAELEVASHRLAMVRQGSRAEELALARGRVAHETSKAFDKNAEARVEAKLARAKLGTQSRVDTARGRVAGAVGEANAARWALSLLEAGARPEELAVAEAEHARIQAQLDHVRAEVERLTLRAPIDGVIATAHLEDKLQATLAVGDIFSEVHDLSAMRAEIALSPSDPLDEIGVGDEVVLRPYGAPNEEVRVRIERSREAAQDSGGQKRVVFVTSPFKLGVRFSGLTGHARIYGAERSLAYAHLYLPLQRLVRVRLWSMW